MDIELAELDDPFGNMSCDFLVFDNLTRGIRGNERDLVVLEVVAQLLGCHDHSAEQLLDMRISGLGIMQYFTDVVHWALYLLVFDNEDGVYGVQCWGDVEEELLLWLWGDKDRWMSRVMLESGERLLSLRRPLEVVLFLQEIEKGSPRSSILAMNRLRVPYIL